MNTFGRAEETTSFYEGTNQIQRMVVARGLLEGITAGAGAAC